MRSKSPTGHETLCKGYSRSHLGVHLDTRLCKFLVHVPCSIPVRLFVLPLPGNEDNRERVC